MNRFIPISILSLLLLILQLHQFCTIVNAENEHEKQLSCFAAKDRMDRLATLLYTKFIGKGVKGKVANAEKRLNPRKDTKDTELRHLVASFANYDISTKKAENVRAAQKFVAYIYQMIMDFPVDHYAETHFKDYVDTFTKMRNVKTMLEKECKKRGKKYMEAAKTMQKGTSVYGMIYMPLDKLKNILTLHDGPTEAELNAPSAVYKYKANVSKMEKIVNILNNALPKLSTMERVKKFFSHGETIFSQPEQFAEIIKEATKDRKRKETERKEGRETDEDKAIREENEAIMIIYEILARKSGYGPQLEEYLSKPAKEQKKLKGKLGNKLLNLLADFYLVVEKTELIDSADYMVYADIYEKKLIPVLEHYAKKKDWNVDLNEAERTLKENLTYYANRYYNPDARDQIITEKWGWIYASDAFYSKPASELVVVKAKEDNQVHDAHGQP